MDELKGQTEKLICNTTLIKFNLSKMDAPVLLRA